MSFPRRKIHLYNSSFPEDISIEVGYLTLLYKHVNSFPSNNKQLLFYRIDIITLFTVLKTSSIGTRKLIQTLF